MNEERKEKTPKRDSFLDGVDDYDDWENVSKSELDLEGMDDPFKESWKQIERKKLDSWHS